MQRKQMLIIGISMPCAGTEKALLSFLNTVDRAVWDVTLLLARHEGELMSALPNDIRLLGPMKLGSLFTLAGKNAPQVLGAFLLAHPSSAPLLLSYSLRILCQPSKRAFLAAQMWVNLMRRYCPSFEEEFGQTDFSLVLSFWGDRTMFYACDKVRAERHLTWLHFDYRHPPREDSLYRAYFARCQRVISVTEDCTRLLRTRFPELATRMITFENRISPARIRTLAAVPLPSIMNEENIPRILTVARICHQKGSDLIPEIMRLLADRGITVTWYLLGDGTSSDLAALHEKARELSVADRLILLGSTPNPYPYFAACDIFVLPSRYEGKPITVEEAKVLGCPIVVCDYLAARKQLENGRLGIIVPTESADGVAGAIQALLESSSLREQYRQACLDSVPGMAGQGMAQTEQLLAGEL